MRWLGQDWRSNKHLWTTQHTRNITFINTQNEGKIKRWKACENKLQKIIRNDHDQVFHLLLFRVLLSTPFESYLHLDFLHCIATIPFVHKNKWNKSFFFKLLNVIFLSICQRPWHKAWTIGGKTVNKKQQICHLKR